MAKYKVNNRVTVTCLEQVRKFLGEDDYENMLREYHFIEYLSKLEKFPIQSPTLHWLVTRGDVEANHNPTKRSLKFTIGGHSYTFGHIEFALITGLPFGEFPNFDEEEETPLRTFLGLKKPKFSYLVSMIKPRKTNAKGEPLKISEADSIRNRKLAVLFIIHRMVFFKSEKNVISTKAICLANDPELFNSYPWGRMVYEEIVKEWVNMFKRIKEPGYGQLKVATFPFAIQAWVLECLMPELSAVLAKSIPGNPLPRILRWDTSHDLEGGYTLARQTIYEAENLQFSRLTPEARELEKDYYKSARAYIDYTPAEAYPKLPGEADDDEGPGFLSLAVLKKLNKKIDTIGDCVSMLEKRVASLEDDRPDGKLVEMNAAKRVRSMFSYEFEVLKHTIEKELRTALKLPPSDIAAPNVFDVVGDKTPAPNLFDVGDKPVYADVDDATFGGPSLSEDHTVDVKIEEPKAEVKIEEPKGEVKIEEPKAEIIIGGRPIRNKRPAPAVVSPFVNQEEAKKAKKKKSDKVDAYLPLPRPYEPSKDYVYDTAMYSMLRVWLSKNATRSGVAGLQSVVRMFPSISCNELELLVSERGWLSGDIIDANLQLLNMQAVEYPDMFPCLRWTCLGSLYSRSVKYGYKLFVQNRKMYAEKGIAGDVTWGQMDIDLCKFVAGINENWKNKPWLSCDRVYGIENIAGSHWAAYEYDFKEKHVRVYDSMSTSYKPEREAIFRMHAVLAPSLYNERQAVEVDGGKMDPDIPFDVSVVDVPQQPNNCDCGVYAIKFVQCKAMKSNMMELQASHFRDFRRKLALDLVKWSKTPLGKYSYVEKDC